DSLQAVKRCVEAFNSMGVGLVLHAGDYVAPFTCSAYRDLKCRLVGVFGNVDGDRFLLRERFSGMGFKVEGEFEELEAGGARIALLHGVYPQLVEALALSGRYSLVVHGHTHRRRAEEVGGALVVYPGEACGYIYGSRSIAVVDTATLKVEFMEL
ncbi:MAG: metallophosphoesterase, partial [Desulfurococcaceae archaeon]